jgi:hypothetical protein
MLFVSWPESDKRQREYGIPPNGRKDASPKMIVDLVARSSLKPKFDLSKKLK